MELIKEIVFKDPPTKWTLHYKKEKFDKEGKRITHQDFYLTANLFYADRTSYHLTSKIIYDFKNYLLPYLSNIPKLEKMKTEMIISKDKHIDLDNTWFFYYKLILDILKTPTKRQLDNSLKKGKSIITTNTILDDNTKFVDEFNCKFIKGENKIVFKIYGEILLEQPKLDLFFI
ncbi:hypothetical protein [Flavobacterium phage V186]|nr:hypothetical protein [Flavobacterium phage V186]QNJ53912.1 hypothetical protein [Flavobacterium phage FCOV-F56]QNJ54138.1 hypothetical protein [Flavobacterium phage V186]